MNGLLCRNTCIVWCESCVFIFAVTWSRDRRGRLCGLHDVSVPFYQAMLGTQTSWWILRLRRKTSHSGDEDILVEPPAEEED